MDKGESAKSVIARRLRLAREMAGLSQGQVAKMMNLHRPSISEGEAGRRGVSAEELSEFARIYGVSISWLAAEGAENSDLKQDRIELAARELSKLKQEDLQRVLDLLEAIRKPEEPHK